MKKDTAANWTANNPVLLNGEIILIDTDNGELRAKVGDGVKTYTQLPFTDEILRNLITGKQNKLTGTQGQYVGFNSSGEAEAVDPPSSLPEGGSEGKLLGYGTEPEWVDSPVMYVTFTVSPETGLITGADKTPLEIAQADASGVVVVGVYQSPGLPEYYHAVNHPTQLFVVMWYTDPGGNGDVAQVQFYSESLGKIIGTQITGTGAIEWSQEFVRDTITTTNKTVRTSAWSSNSTYADLGFNYRASVSVSDVTTSYIPDINFSPADQYSGNLASFADTYNGGVHIYAKTKPTEIVTIESAIFTRS